MCALYTHVCSTLRTVCFKAIFLLFVQHIVYQWNAVGIDFRTNFSRETNSGRQRRFQMSGRAKKLLISMEPQKARQWKTRELAPYCSDGKHGSANRRKQNAQGATRCLQIGSDQTSAVQCRLTDNYSRAKITAILRLNFLTYFIITRKTIRLYIDACGHLTILMNRSRVSHYFRATFFHSRVFHP